MTTAFERRLDALYALTRRVAGEDEGDPLDEALQAVLDATPARACIAFGVDGSRQPVAERGLLVRAGMDARAVKRALHRLASHAATTRRALLISDTRLETLDAPEASELAKAGIGAVAFEPVLYRRTVLAVLVAAYDYPELLDENAGQHLATVAHVTALALESVPRGELPPAERQRPVDAGPVGLVAATVAHELDAPSGALVVQNQALRQIAEQLIGLSEAGVSEVALLANELNELSQEIGVAVGRLNQASDRMRSMRGPEGVPQHVDVSLVARRALVQVRGLFSRRKIEFAEQYGGDCLTLGRDDELEQVAYNLLLNAAEALSDASRPEVWLKVHADAKHVWLVVEDNGPGVPADQVQNVFRPFFTTKTKEHGAGLGLKVVREVIAAHGGHIEVHARFGGGASFRVVLPRASSLPDAHTNIVSRPNNDSGIRQVFVVDDDPMFARALRRGLKPHEVRTASSASEAEMALLDPGYSPELIVCDIALPGANGDVLHQRIRARRPELGKRFVFVTGAALGKREADYLKGSGCLTLLKPIDVPQLRTLIEADENADNSAPKSVRTLAEPPESERPTLFPPRY